MRLVALLGLVLLLAGCGLLSQPTAAPQIEFTPLPTPEPTSTPVPKPTRAPSLTPQPTPTLTPAQRVEQMIQQWIAEDAATGQTPTPTPVPTPTPTPTPLDPTLLQGIFERYYNIPVRGRSPYQEWFADQWQIPATEYALQREGLLGEATTQTFLEYLVEMGERPVSWLGGEYFEALTALPAAKQREIYERVPDFVVPTVYYGYLQENNVSWMAESLVAQRFSGPVVRQYQISPRAADETFLDYLKREYHSE